MSKLGSLQKLCNPVSLDGLIAEFSLVAKRAFEEEGFDPATVEEVMKKMEAEAEASFAAMRAAEGEQLAAADKLLNDVMDSGMAELDEITKYGSAELKTLSALETAALKVSKRLTAAAAAAANRYLDAAVASAAASAAAKSAHKHMHTHFFPGSRVYTVCITMMIEREKLIRFLKMGHSTMFVFEMKDGYDYRNHMNNMALFNKTVKKLHKEITKNKNATDDQIKMIAQIQANKNIAWMEGPLGWTAWVEQFEDLLH